MTNTLTARINAAMSLGMEQINSEWAPFCDLFAELFGEEALANATKDGLGGHEIFQMHDAMLKIAQKEEENTWIPSMHRGLWLAKTFDRS